GQRPKLRLQRRLQLGGPGARLQRRDGRGTTSYHQDVQRLAAFDGSGDLGKPTFAVEQIGRHVAGRLVFGTRIVSTHRGRGDEAGDQHRAEDGGPHRLPPAMSALPMVPFFAPLSAKRLYHEITHAMPDMIRMPSKLIAKCIRAPPAISARTKWPAKARNTP